MYLCTPKAPLHSIYKCLMTMCSWSAILCLVCDGIQGNYSVTTLGVYYNIVPSAGVLITL